jgi:glycosyltransferase involved in cell wall biosynthesis
MVTHARHYEILDRWAGRRFDHVVGCSQSVEDYLLYRYGYQAARVSHVFNGWSGSPVSAPAEPASAQTIVCVARLRAQKNHEVLLDALSLVREHLPSVRLRLVGDGERREALQAKVRQTGLEDCVEFLGSVEDVWPVLADAQVFVLASYYEPLGIAALEAMAAGLPVIASRVGGLREIVDDGTTGLLVAPGDVDELATSIRRVLSDPALAGRMSERAREAADGYRAERMVEGYDRVYERLLMERSRC